MSLKPEAGGIAPVCGHYIDGRYVEDEPAFDVRRPSDGASYAAAPSGDTATVDRAVRSAQSALTDSGWGTCAPRDRARILRRWADLIEADKVELGRLEAVGSTRPISETTAWDVPFTAEGIRFFAEFADKHGGEVAATQHDQLGLIIAEPIGVIGAIAPWNFPLVMGSWKCAPAMAAGNAVVLKPSEMTPFSIMRMAELAVEAGVPPGIFNIVNGEGHTTGDAIVRHEGIGKVTFTGSTRTGAVIMAACAESGTKPVTLELGGKSPQVVFSDVQDLDRVAETVSRAILANAGQVCNAGSRLLLQRDIAEPIVDRLVKLIAQADAGPTWSTQTNFSPIISGKQRDAIAGVVSRATEAGAEVLARGELLNESDGGSYYAPTILDNAESDMEAVREEIFGPVMTVQRFDDDDEGISLANDTYYGLAAGVYTSDMNRGLRAMREIQAGTVWINRYGRTADFIIPTGGYKRSGIGKDLGRSAFESNLRFKSALIAIDSR
jgi:aldehyde dehydrogenase (NAD+)